MSASQARGSTRFNLAVSISEAMTAQLSPSSSKPAKSVLAFERQRPDAALDGVGIQFDASVDEEVAAAVAVPQCIADCLGEATFCG